VWSKIKQQILFRRVPHTVTSWRFLLPGQSQAIGLHRKVFLQAWPSLPRWAWLMIFLYSAMTWLLFFSWRQIWFCMSKKRVELDKTCNISPFRQLVDLLTLALLHFIPPVFYYKYELYLKPKNQWLDYIYTHELPHWHQLLSVKGSHLDSRKVLTDKKAFACRMADQEIASVNSVAYLTKNSIVKADKIFIGQSLFLKPNEGSQGRGVFELQCDEGSKTYQLLGGGEIITGRKKILTRINQLLQSENYLVQALLKNHPKIIELCDTTKLVTLRMVTAYVDQQATLLFATVEIPRADNANSWTLFAVEVTTGRLFDNCSLIKEANHPDLSGEIVPFWQGCVNLCLDAHTKLPDILTVGWDVVITNSGVKLLEGNINWGVETHQILTGAPALQTPLINAYKPLVK